MKRVLYEHGFRIFFLSCLVLFTLFALSGPVSAMWSTTGNELKNIQTIRVIPDSKIVGIYPNIVADSGTCSIVGDWRVYSNPDYPWITTFNADGTWSDPSGEYGNWQLIDATTQTYQFDVYFDGTYGGTWQMSISSDCVSSTATCVSQPGRIVYGKLLNLNGVISFDKDEYTDINGCTRVKVVDPSLNNPNRPDQVTVKITSLDTVTHELVESNLDLHEEGTNSGIFTNAFVYNPPLPAGVWVSTANPGAFSATYFNVKAPAVATYKFSGSIKGRVMKGIWKGNIIIDLVPVENAQVYAYKSGAHAGKEVFTNAQGLYIIDSLEPGTYEVTANFDGVNNEYKKTAEVRINQITPLDFPSNIEGILKAITKSNAAQNYIRLRQAYMEHSWSVYRIGLSASFASLLMGINEIAAHHAYDLYAHLYDAAQNLPGDPIENAKKQADEAISQLEKIIGDPPDPHYNEVYQVCATAQIDLPPEYKGTLLGGQISVANALANQNAVDDALLVSFERYQGAMDAGDLDSVYLQLDTLDRYSSWLKANSTTLENRAVEFRDIIQSEKLAHESDLFELQQNLATEGINQIERDQLKSLNMTDEDIILYQEVLTNLNYDELLGSANGYIEYAQNRSEFADSFASQLRDIRIHLTQILPPLVANFTANITSGAAPLNVQFTDASSNPYGWAWFFGDETYTQAWTKQTASAGWSERLGHSSVVMPDGSIVLMGGGVEFISANNDVWQSRDNGITWTLMNASAGWVPRYHHSSVVLSDGSIVLMGGLDLFSLKNDTWRSTDGGVTWKELPDAGWSARQGQSSVVMLDGSIVVMGGSDTGSLKNDVWRSMDKGTTWTQLPDAIWSARQGQSSVVLPDGSIVLTGGGVSNGFKNDTWRSTDGGASWTQLPDAGWSERWYHSTVTMPDGSIVLTGGMDNGGNFRNDTWRSTDGGVTWKELPDAGWSGRDAYTSVVMPDGSIVLLGGYDHSYSGYRNDVWRFMPIGSSEKDPSHTYTTPGIYSVALQVYNDGGFSSTRKTGFITIGVHILPLPSISNPPTDPDGDGLYEDLNANNRKDFNDVVLIFNQMQWIAANEPVSAFDFNGNRRIDFNDIVKLFGEI
jgi:PKD repeat protein